MIGQPIKTYDDIQRYFNLYTSFLTDAKLKNICNLLLEYKDFWIWPASIDKHHSYPYGLVIHTLEVVKSSIALGNLVPSFNRDILITSALFHDLAKIWDYQIDKIGILENRSYIKINDTLGWFKSDYHGKVHHISGSMAEFTALAKINNLNLDLIHQIQHCIISHHGFNKEFGSPRRPESTEAIILHEADMLSATNTIYPTINFNLSPSDIAYLIP